MKIVFLDSHALNPGDLSWEPLQALGELVLYPNTQPDSVIERSCDAEVLVVNKVVLGESQFAQLPKLKLVLVAATGYDTIDTISASAHGITVCNVPSYSTQEVAQQTLALILAHTNRVEHYTHEVTCGEWPRQSQFCYWNTPLMAISSLKVAIVGMGNIGTAVAQILRAMKVQVMAVTHRSENEMPEGVMRVSLEEAFATADIISLHCPLTEQNRGFVSEALLQTMKPGSMLINTARGALVSPADVAAALRTGHLGAYCCDVLDQEPPAENHPLLSAPNVYITPHIAWAAPQTRARIISIMAENLRKFMQGVPQNKVNP